MPIDRKTHNYWMSETWMPNWPCPQCRASLTMVKGSYKSEPDRKTKLNKDDPHFDPEEPSGRFVCLLPCSRPNCEVCAVAGRYVVERDETGWCEACKPLSITPPPMLIQI